MFIEYLVIFNSCESLYLLFMSIREFYFDPYQLKKGLERQPCSWNISALTERTKP